MNLKLAAASLPLACQIEIGSVPKCVEDFCRILNDAAERDWIAFAAECKRENEIATSQDSESYWREKLDAEGATWERDAAEDHERMFPKEEV